MLHDSAVQTIRRRKALLLDTSVWITLADGRTESAQALRSVLQYLTAKERIFCPLAAPVIWELRKQSGPSLTRTTALMEELSLNISFRSFDDIVDTEIDHLLGYLRTGTFKPLAVEQIYGPLLSYLNFGFNLQPGPAPSTNTALYTHCAGMLQNMSLTALIKMLGGQSSPTVERQPEYQNANIARRELVRQSGVPAARFEQEALAKSILLPRLNKKRSALPIDEQLRVLAKTMALPRNPRYDSVLEHMLHFLPMLSAYAQMLSVSGMDPNRKDRFNDFFDREILIYALAYSSGFAAFDNWIRSLVDLCAKDRFPGLMPFMGEPAELASYLEKTF